mgnify:CR=1 FL=1
MGIFSGTMGATLVLFRSGIFFSRCKLGKTNLKNISFGPQTFEGTCTDMFCVCTGRGNFGAGHKCLQISLGALQFLQSQ